MLIFLSCGIVVAISVFSKLLTEIKWTTCTKIKELYDILRKIGEPRLAVMGRKVQWKGYLSQFCTMKDLNEDADSSWSQYYGNRAVVRNLIGHGQHAGQSSRYSGYDKESIKRTMLEHDAIFRNQLYELHRLYNRQKELMEELQKKGPYKYLQADTSQSNSFSSQIPSNSTNRIWHMPPLPATTTSYNKVPFTVTDGKVCPLNFLKENSAQPGPVLIGKHTAMENDDIIGSNHERCPRRMFDLQLPADVYIDCEDAEKSEKEIVAESSSVTMNPLNSIRTAYPENDMKFTLGTIDARNCRVDGWKSDLCTQNRLAAYSLADLNEPVKENFCERTAGPVSCNFVSLITTLEDNRGHHLPTRSNTNNKGLKSAFFRAELNEEDTYPNLLHSDKEVTQGRSFFNYESGQSTSNTTLFSTGSAKEKLPMPSEATQLKLKKPLEILSPDRIKGDLWFKQTQTHGIEISGRRLPHEQSANSTSNSFSVLRSRDYTSSNASPFLPSWTNLSNSATHVPLPVQSLRCFNGTVAQKHSSPSESEHNGDLWSHLRLGANQSSCQNGFNDGEFKLDYDSAISFGNRYRDSSIDNKTESQGTRDRARLLLNGFQDRGTSQSKTAVSDFKGKCDSPSGVLSWLRKPGGSPSSHIELDYSQGYPQLKPSCTAIYPGPEKKQETEKSRPLFDMQDLPSTSQVPETITNTRLFGFSLFDKTRPIPTVSSSRQECIEKVEIKALSLENPIALGGLDAKSSSISSRNHINLNFNPDESEIVVNPSQFSAPSVASEINLEVPVTSQAEKSDEALVNEAAGNIIWMFTDKCTRLDNISCPPFPPVLSDTLHWFAVIVSSGANELDMFEHMTLELEETKPEDYWHAPWKEEDRKDDDDDDDERKCTVASLLFAKPRRGQGRKRRQRKDFQKDILPGLASLSRQEVTEDIQTIGGLMRVSGQPWVAGGAKRRNMGRNGTNYSRARRGRLPRNLTEVGPPLPPEPVGWGRTTRRCRRQRGPPVTNVVASIT